MSGWRVSISELLMGTAVVGTAVVALQRIGLGAHLNGAAAGRFAGAGALPARGISILKPLCGLDDGLAKSLEMFASLPYQPYELLLGVADTADAAYSLAQHMAAKYPGKVRVVVQGASTGLNPKVNQLVGLAGAARHDILLISDSNVRPPQGYLEEISALFADPAVGCVTNPVSGYGHKSYGAMLDNLQSATTAATCTVAHQLGRPVVIGKSQAVRRDVLARLGGFAAYADVLAEDYLIGRDVGRLGYRVALARRPVFTYTAKKDLPAFAGRVSRWTTMQATATESALPAAGMGLLNPIPLGLAAFALAPSWATAGRLAGVIAAKTALDLSAAHALGVRPLGWREAAAIPVKDVVAFGAWGYGLVNRTVSWRGNQLQVGKETRLTARQPSAILEASVPPPTPAQVVAEQYPVRLSAPSPTSVAGSSGPGALPSTQPAATPSVRPLTAAPPRPHFGPPRRGGQRARLRSRGAGRRTGSGPG